jgi:hypothetical protein
MSSISRKTYEEVLNEMIMNMAMNTPTTDIRSGSVFNAYLNVLEENEKKMALLRFLKKLDSKFERCSMLESLIEAHRSYSRL